MTTTHKKQTVIGRINFDRKIMYVGRRIPTQQILKSALGKLAGKATVPGFLIVTGSKPGVLIHPVVWDGKDIYVRDGKVGSLSACNATKQPFKAEVVDRGTLLSRLVKFNRVIECRSVATGKKHTVALLNPNGEQYVAGVEVTPKGLAPINLEPIAAYNRPEVQYKDFKDVKVDIRRFLGILR